MHLSSPLEVLSMSTKHECKHSHLSLVITLLPTGPIDKVSIDIQKILLKRNIHLYLNYNACNLTFWRRIPILCPLVSFLKPPGSTSVVLFSQDLPGVSQAKMVA